MITEEKRPTSQNTSYLKESSLADELAEHHNLKGIADLIEVDISDVQLAYDCVGAGTRKNTANEDEEAIYLSHLAHMVRVAVMVKHFFPEDKIGRRLAILHDIKEEALPGREEMYLRSDLAPLIDLLTEVTPSNEEVSNIENKIPVEFSAYYVAKYRAYIMTLRENWEIFRPLELCDRLDGSNSLSYLLDKRYANRLKSKSLQSIGRIWATITDEEGEVAEMIKINCRAWFPRLGVTEDEIEVSSKYFKNNT